jgi:putative membrane protein insertion efficiency factor
MHSLYPIQWPAQHSTGHHRTPGSGQCGAPQSHEAPAAGGLSPPSPRPPGWMGHRSESSSRDGGSPFRGSDERAPAHFPEAAPRGPAGANGLWGVSSKGIRAAALGLIRFYQMCLTPVLLPSFCRYYPSCSAYACEAIEKWGVWQGVGLTVRRLLRCRPLGGCGYDPVP